MFECDRNAIDEEQYRELFSTQAERDPDDEINDRWAQQQQLEEQQQWELQQRERENDKTISSR